jgi:hypothetical protein
MAYDAAMGRIVLFGGQSCSGGFCGQLADTWVWDAGSETWSQILPAAGPVTRTSASMAYDAAHSNLVLFSGQYSTGRTAPLADTWTWQGSIIPCAAGDVNCDQHVDATDALCVLRIVALLPTTAACPIPPPGNPDVNDDPADDGPNHADATDALCILRHVAQLPATPACSVFSAGQPNSTGASARRRALTSVREIPAGTSPAAPLLIGSAERTLWFARMRVVRTRRRKRWGWCRAQPPPQAGAEAEAAPTGPPNAWSAA